MEGGGNIWNLSYKFVKDISIFRISVFTLSGERNVFKIKKIAPYSHFCEEEKQTWLHKMRHIIDFLKKNLKFSKLSNYKKKIFRKFK